MPVPLFKLLSLTHFKSDDSSGSQAGPDSSVESDSASTLQQGTDRPGTHSICTSKAAPHTVNPGNVQARQGASELQAGIRQKRGVTTSDHLHQSVNGDNKQKDPLRWFGVLVPPSLRTAQAQFTSGNMSRLGRCARINVHHWHCTVPIRAIIVVDSTRLSCLGAAMVFHGMLFSI